jgi:hypothetical protein
VTKEIQQENKKAARKETHLSEEYKTIQVKKTEKDDEDAAYIDMITERSYILSEEGTFLFYWNLCVIVSAVY